MSVPTQQMPPYRAAMARGEWDRAIAILEASAEDAGHRMSDQHALVLAELYHLRGNQDEAVALLNRLTASTDVEVAVRALVQLAHFQLRGQPEQTKPIRELLDKASQLAGEDRHLKGLVTHALGKLRLKCNEIQTAGELLEEARELLEDGPEQDLAQLLDSLASFYGHRGQRQLSLAFYCRSLAKKAQLGDLYGIAVTMGNLGRSHLRINQAELALSCFLDDLRIAERLSDIRGQVVVKTNIAQALTKLGRYQEARTMLRELLPIARQRNWRQEQTYALKDLGRATALDGDNERGQSYFDQALSLQPEGQPTYAKGQILMARGEVYQRTGDKEAAEQALCQARSIFAALRAREDESRAVLELARINLERGRVNSCVHQIEEGISLATTVETEVAPAFKEVLHRANLARRTQALPHSVGPYRVISRLGAGGFGEVYKGFDGRHDASRQDVAIKVIRLDGASDARRSQERIARFRREYQILQRISHPNVVSLLDFGEEPLPYLVEEYLEGGDLRARALGGPLTLEEGLDLLRGVLSGLAHVHANGVVHRDLKPGNVLLRQNGTPVIVDFGLARTLDLPALTLQSAVLGTLAYMSPEQLRGESVDERADIYSLGALFYKLFSGHAPHTGNDLASLTRDLEHRHVPPIQTLCPELPEPLTQFIMVCLEKNREHRFGSVQAAIKQLHEAGLLSDEQPA